MNKNVFIVLVWLEYLTTMRVGVFDSGIGGLNVLAKMMQIYPSNEYLFYADNLNMPYGTKDIDVVINGVRKGMDYFLFSGVDEVIIACNTACCLAGDLIKREYPFKVVKVTDTVVEMLKNEDKVIFFATMNTVKSLDGSFGDNLRLVGLPTFASRIERVAPRFYRLYGDVRELAKNVLPGETIALGCTHYTYFQPYFSSLGYKVISEISNLSGCLTDNRNIRYPKMLLTNPLETTKYYKILRYLVQ